MVEPQEDFFLKMMNNINTYQNELKIKNDEEAPYIAERASINLRIV